MHKANFIKEDKRVSSHPCKFSDKLSEHNSIRNNNKHKIVMVREHPKFRRVLLILFPKGIMKKFPNNSLIPKKTPFM